MRCSGLALLVFLAFSYSLTAQEPPSNEVVQEMLQYSIELEEQKRYEEAIAYLKERESLIKSSEQDSLISQWYNRMADLEHAYGSGEEALRCQRLATASAKTGYPMSHPQRGHSLFRYGRLLHVVAGEPDSSISYLRLALEAYSEAEKPIDAADCWRNIGLIKAGRFEYSEALDAYEKAADLLKAIPHEYPQIYAAEKENYLRYLSWNLLNQADIYYRIDALEPMRNLLNRSQDLLVHHQEEFPGLAREAQENEARLYTYLKDFDKAAQLYESILNKIEPGSEPRYEQRLLTKIAQVYGTDGYNYEQAAEYWQKSIDHDARFPVSARLSMVPVLREAARIQNNLGNLAEAESFLQQAREYLQDANPLQSAVLYFNEARLYQQRGAYEQALQAVEQGASTFNFPQSSSLANIQAIRSMILFARFQKSGQPADLEQSENWARQSLNTLESYEDRTFQQRSYGEYYRIPTECLLQCLVTRYQQQADPVILNEIFQLMEQSRGRSLRMGRAWDQHQQDSRYPTALIDRYRMALKERRELMQERFRLEQGGTASDRLVELGDSLVQLDQQIRELKGQMHQVHPLSAPAADLASVQKQLPNDQSAVLLFFAGDSTVFTLSVTSSAAEIFQQPWTPENQQLIHKLGDQVEHPQTDERILGQLLYEAYEEWLAPALTPLGSGVKRLYIVPDGSLTALPWAALCSAPPEGKDYRRWPYLIRDFSLGFLPYVGGLLPMSREQNNDFSVGCFAPEYGMNPKTVNLENGRLGMNDLVREGYWHLPGAQEEAATIAENYDSFAELFNQQLTKARFREEAPRFSVLHLAMHAIPNLYDPANAYLLFPADSVAEARLNAWEALSLEWNADLMVLSACYSGDGPWRSGEGVMSLAYAWQEAGIPSVLSNSWAVADQFSSALMIAFHQNVQNGLSLDEALRQAQLTYLEDAQPLASAHPFYWAGFQLQGQNAPLVESKWPWWLGGGLAVLVVLMVLRIRRSN